MKKRDVLEIKEDTRRATSRQIQGRPWKQRR